MLAQVPISHCGFLSPTTPCPALSQQHTSLHRFGPAGLPHFPRSLGQGRSVRRMMRQLPSEDDTQDLLPFQTPELGPRQQLFGGLFAAGFFLGPLLDGIHSFAKLLIYEVGAVDIGPLHTSVTVPLLLGSFYAVAGAIILFLDEWRTPGGVSIPPRVAGLCLVTTIALLALSSVLFVSGYTFNVITVALFALGMAQWAFVDGTIQGLGLSVLSAIVAPAAELVLMSVWHVWYYPRADWVLSNSDIIYTGFPTFVPFCYLFYTTWVVALTRAWKAYLEGNIDKDL